VIRITISREAFDAIERTLPPDAELRANVKKEGSMCFLYVTKSLLNRLDAERLRGEELSDTIIRISWLAHRA